MAPPITAIHQFLPTFAPRDAVSGHTKHIQVALHDLGYESEIYAEHVHPDESRRAHTFDTFSDRFHPGTILYYRLSTGSKMASRLAARPEPFTIDYQNITPVEFMAGWEPLVASFLRRGRRDLARLARRTAFATAGSHYNASELIAAGYPRVEVVPILIDTDQFHHAVDADLLERLGNQKAQGGIDLLFVGRIAPNKCQHDLIRLLAYYRATCDPKARLRLVGGSSSHAYETTLRQYVEGLGLGDAVEFAGSVTDAELGAQYKNADVFVSMSQHEGFCIPLVEAMANDVPVVALASSAVPEILGDGGLVMPTNDLALFSAAIQRIVTDSATREEFIAAGRARMAHFSLAEGRRILRDAVEAMVETVNAGF